MTRRKLMSNIRTCLKDEELLVDDAAREAAVIAMDCTLDYLLTFTLDLSEQLVSQELHSEAMTAGTLIDKIKRLRSD